MELNVNVKSVSGKKNRITTIPVTYSRDEKTVRELIEETVRYCVSDYNKRKENGEHWFHTEEQVRFLDDWKRYSSVYG